MTVLNEPPLVERNHSFPDDPARFFHEESWNAFGAAIGSLGLYHAPACGVWPRWQHWAMIVFLNLWAILNSFNALAVPFDANRYSALSTDIRMAVLMKALQYDRYLKKTRKELKIAILFPSNNTREMAEADDVYEQLKSLAKKRIQGLTLKFGLISTIDWPVLKDQLESSHTNIVYIVREQKTLLPELQAFAQQKKILIISGTAWHGTKGAALIAVRRGNSPRVIVDLKESRAQGANFDSTFLRFTDLIR